MGIKERFYSPTPKKMRIMGDLFLVLIPVVQGIIAAAPNLSGNTQYWLGSVCTISLVIAKFITNMFTDKQADQ